MKINVIIGAGQLGSRHLQGMLRRPSTEEIYVLDSSPSSLDVARERSNEIPHKHQLKFTSDWDEIPRNVDLVIVATNANVREAVVLRLLESFSVKYLVLEKILFQTLSAYKTVLEVLENKNIRTWVNHPRRMYSHYKAIKSKLRLNPGEIVFTATGANWGLGCNALHFIDLFCYLSGSQISSLHGDLLDGKLYESKRKGYYEFTGSLTGILKDGSKFIITSFADSDPGPVTVTVSNSTFRWTIQEAANTQVLCSCRDNSFQFETSTSVMGFQSTLTTDLMTDIFEDENCELPTYQEACASHEPFIELMLSKYVSFSGKQTDVCPIT